VSIPFTHDTASHVTLSYRQGVGFVGGIPYAIKRIGFGLYSAAIRLQEFEFVCKYHMIVMLCFQYYFYTRVSIPYFQVII
jgi:hypothetical protein